MLGESLSSDGGLYSEEQRQKILTTKEIAGVPQDLATDLLLQNGWNVERAVESYLALVDGSGASYGGGNGNNYSSNSNSNVSVNSSNSNNGSSLRRRDIASSSGSSGGGSARQSQSNSSSNSNSSNNNNNNSSSSSYGAGESEVGLLGSIVRGLLRPFEWLYQSQLVANLDGESAAFRAAFLEEFNNGSTTVGSEDGQDQRLALELFSGSQQSAVQSAHQQNRHLLVYLHSPIHQDSEAFCHNVIFTPQFAKMLSDNNIIFWAGSLWDAEAYKLSEDLKVSQFPFLGLLICHQRNSARCLTKIEGIMDCQQVIGRLVAGVVGSGLLLNEVRQVREERVQARSLREAQDEEFREIQAAARREREQREANEREAKMKAEREAEEARLRQHEAEQAAELEKAIQMSSQIALDSDMDARRARLGAEPGPEVPASSVATIRFQTPVGAKLVRKFLKTDLVERLYDFVILHFYDQKLDDSNLKMRNILISINMPKQDLEDQKVTIEAVGLFPRGAVFVQDLDT